MGKKKNDRLLTEVELELMSVIWQTDQCTIRGIVDQLPADRKLAYTSVATMMRILEEKGFLASEGGEKTHTFRPLVAREDYEKTTLNHVAEKLFAGNSSAMVMKLLDETDLSKEELRAIKKTLEEKLKS